MWLAQMHEHSSSNVTFQCRERSSSFTCAIRGFRKESGTWKCVATRSGPSVRVLASQLQHVVGSQTNSTKTHHGSESKKCLALCVCEQQTNQENQEEAPVEACTGPERRCFTNCKGTRCAQHARKCGCWALALVRAMVTIGSGRSVQHAVVGHSAQ